jgi:4-hydroxy-tetrahydrodipicolinate synthase
VNLRLAAGPAFCQLSGEDGTIGAFLGQGGDGCISVTSNVAPKMCSELHAAWRERDIDTFARLRDRLMPLHGALFCEPSPAPAKYGASLLGKCDAAVRLPLAPLSEAGQTKVRDAMRHCGLIN